MSSFSSFPLTSALSRSVRETFSAILEGASQLPESAALMLESAQQSALAAKEAAGEFVDSAVDVASELMEQPEVRVLAVNTLLLVLLCVVGLLFYTFRRALQHAPYSGGLKSITYMVLGCLFICFIEVGYQPPYLIKSICKITLFVACITIFQVVDADAKLLDMFARPRARQLLIGLAEGVGVYALILCSFLVFRRHVDFSRIAQALSNDGSINRDNFLFVSLYISFFNSLLEEIFFRGFAYLSLRRYIPERIAASLSAMAFSLYHFVIMASWFELVIFVVLLLSLFVAGLLFNWMDAKSDNIYNSWLVHMFANFAINTVGFLMFSMI